MNMPSLVCNCNAKAQYVMQWKSTLSVFMAQKLVFTCNETICSVHMGMSYYIVKQQLMQRFLFITRMQHLAMISLQLFLNKFVVVCSSSVHYSRISIAILPIQYEYD